MDVTSGGQTVRKCEEVTAIADVSGISSEKEKLDAELPYTAIALPASNLSASPMKIVIILSLFATVAMSCGDNAFRCVNPDTSVDQDWHHTELCMDRVGFSDTCWCYHRAETYAVPTGDDIQAFKDCCQSYDNFAYRQC